MNRHELSAILFSDIVGFSRLMNHDEERTLNLIRKNRRIHKNIINRYHGKWLKEMGDGTLAEFKTISEAVYCAGDLMKTCQQERIDLRIGIHLGEIIKENGDIFGDPVNIASRLESIADPGQIVVSQSVMRNIKNKPGIYTKSLIETELKNIDDPIKIYGVTFIDAQIFLIKKLQSKNKRIKKIVLTAAATLFLFLSSQFIDIFVCSDLNPGYEISTLI